MDSNADFLGVERPANLGVTAGSVVNPEVNLGGLPMSFGLLVNRLSVVAAYVAFAFVGAIVLGVF